MENKLVKVVVKKPTQIMEKDKITSDQMDISFGGRVKKL